MKKLKLCLLIVVCLCLFGCGKHPLSSSSFKKIMRDNDFYVVNSKSQFEEYDYILDSYVATNKNYNIEFYIVENNEYAKAFYNLNKDIFDAERTTTSMYTETNLKNTNKYVLTTDSNYKMLSMVDNTILYIDVNKKYKNEVNKVVKKLGY